MIAGFYQNDLAQVWENHSALIRLGSVAALGIFVLRSLRNRLSHEAKEKAASQLLSPGFLSQLVEDHQHVSQLWGVPKRSVVRCADIVAIAHAGDGRASTTDRITLQWQVEGPDGELVSSVPQQV